MAEKLTKTEKRIYASGRAKGAASARERSKKDDVVEALATAAGAYGGQKFFANAGTPMLESVPLHYTLGPALILLAGRGRKSRGKSVIGGLGVGLVAGQLGVAGFKAATPLFGNGG
jgi:hypothetical protein